MRSGFKNEVGVDGKVKIGRPRKSIKYDLRRKVPQAMRVVQEALDGELAVGQAGGQVSMAKWIIQMALIEEEANTKPGGYEDKIKEMQG